jgi:amidase
MSPVAHAADGGGSIRIPSSCCGLFGMKPSRGRISSGPRFGEHWHGFSTSGPLGRSVKDVAALLDVMSGYCTGDPYWAPPPSVPFADEVGRDPGRLKIGFTLTSPNEIPADPEVVTAVEQAAKLLESLGHEVEEAAPRWIDQSLAPAFVQLIQTGTAVVDFLPLDQMEPLNRFLIESARDISSAQHIHALTQAHQYARRVVAFWDDYDVLLTPTLARPPLPVGWIFSDDDPAMQLIRSGMFIPYTPAANITGQPAASVPLHTSADGLPVGVQLMGKPAGEAELLRLCGQLEAAQPWAQRIPELA